MSAYRAPTCRSLFSSSPGVIFPSLPLLLPLTSLIFSSKVHLKFRCFQPPAKSRACVWSACGCIECDNSTVTFIMMFYCLLQGKVPLLSSPPTQPSAETVKGQGQHSSGRDRLPPGSSRGLIFFLFDLLGKRWRLTDMPLNLYIFRFQHLGGICQTWSRFPLRLALSHVRNFLKVPQVICPFLKDRPL